MRRDDLERFGAAPDDARREPGRADLGDEDARPTVRGRRTAAAAACLVTNRETDFRTVDRGRGAPLAHREPAPGFGLLSRVRRASTSVCLSTLVAAAREQDSHYREPRARHSTNPADHPARETRRSTSCSRRTVSPCLLKRSTRRAWSRIVPARVFTAAVLSGRRSRPAAGLPNRAAPAPSPVPSIAVTSTSTAVSGVLDAIGTSIVVAARPSGNSVPTIDSFTPRSRRQCLPGVGCFENCVGVGVPAVVQRWARRHTHVGVDDRAPLARGGEDGARGRLRTGYRCGEPSSGRGLDDFEGQARARAVGDLHHLLRSCPEHEAQPVFRVGCRDCLEEVCGEEKKLRRGLDCD
jgi:hypothetical protein